MKKMLELTYAFILSFFSVLLEVIQNQNNSIVMFLTTVFGASTFFCCASVNRPYKIRCCGYNYHRVNVWGI